MSFAIGRKRRWAALWLTVCCLSLCGGCAKPKLEDPNKIVQVHGQVVYKGRPVPGAHLTFHREAVGEIVGESAFAISDTQGQFISMTNDTGGIFPGEYRVTVTHDRLTLPKNYADVESTPLELVVLEDESDQEFPVQLND